MIGKNVLSDPVCIIVRSFFLFLGVSSWVVSLTVFSESLSNQVIFGLGENLAPESDSFSFLLSCQSFKSTIDQTSFFFPKAKTDRSEESVSLLFIILYDFILGSFFDLFPQFFLKFKPRRILYFQSKQFL